MQRLFCSIVFLFVLGVVRGAHCQDYPGRMFELCSRYGQSHVPGWSTSSQMRNGTSPPLIEAVRGDHRDGVCRGYLSVGPSGHRRDVLVFTLRCWQGTCVPL